MTTKRTIIEALDKAGAIFESCWDSLDTVKYAPSAIDLRRDLIDFQPRLATALYDLETLRTGVRHEARAVVAKKQALSKRYLSRRLKALARYGQVLERGIDVGKMIGDSFAWFFYQRERELVRRHMQQQQTRPAIGIGGRGEIEFIRRLPKINQYFVIYHGTTTFLRLGDITLVDTRTLTVAGIGELKSHATAPGQMSIMVTMIGDKLSKDVIPPLQEGAGAPARMDLSDQQKDRLRRQIRRIDQSFQQKKAAQSLRKQTVTIESNFAKLSELHANASYRRFEWVKASAGLAIGGLKLRTGSFSRSLFGGSKIKFERKFDRLTEVARDVVDQSIPDNSLEIGFVPFASRGRYSLMLEMRPIFWWALRRGVARDLVFGHFLVTTLYNRAFLIKRLRALGLNVTIEKNRDLVVTKPFRAGNLAVHGMRYFEAIIQRYLIPEDAIIEMIEKLIDEMNRSAIDGSAVVHLDLQFALD